MILNLPYVNDYSLCRQTVTAYHFADGAVTRMVISGVYMEYKKATQANDGRESEQNKFLLVIPCAESPIAIGDKVVMGEGPEVDATDPVRWWRTFVPAAHFGLVVVKDLAPWFWDGAQVHVEAWG